MLTFHTREMKAVFSIRFKNIANLTPPVQRAIYRFVAEDQSTPDNQVWKEEDASMMITLDFDDPSLVVDLRQL